ncbi:MAG: oxidoreductase, partial [Cyanobacteria bacterium REEB65]|nr:oxidoreductase [Cyanobacteria bacterium REEB65]
VVAQPKVGDIGVAVFCHNDISSAKNTKAPANPGSRRRFDWADGLYLGGFLGPTPTQFITLDDSAGITIQSAAGKPVNITAPGGLVINGNVNVTGTISASGDITGSGTSLHTHVHGGVTTGSGNTGAPV